MFAELMFKPISGDDDLATFQSDIDLIANCVQKDHATHACNDPTSSRKILLLI